MIKCSGDEESRLWQKAGTCGLPSAGEAIAEDLQVMLSQPKAGRFLVYERGPPYLLLVSAGNSQIEAVLGFSC